MAEENPDEIAYTITKYLEDGQTITEHSSRNYTGKASVVYATKDKYEGDFKQGMKDGKSPMTGRYLRTARRHLRPGAHAAGTGSGTGTST